MTKAAAPQPAVAPSSIRFAVLATDVVTFRVRDSALEVLLGKVNLPPHFPDSWGVIGGLIRPEETAEQAVDRHIQTKAGLGRIYREQLETFSRVDRDPRGRVVSVAYIALVDPDHSEPEEKDGKEGRIATRWCPVSRLPKLAYDHGDIVKTAIERLQARIGYTNIAQHLLPRSFTMSELQGIYQAVLGRDLDKRNFNRWILGLSMVEATGQQRKEGAHRPAALYRFAQRQTRITAGL